MSYEKEFVSSQEHDRFNAITTLLQKLGSFESDESIQFVSDTQPSRKPNLTFNTLDTLTAICTRNKEVLAMVVSRIHQSGIDLACIQEQNNALEEDTGVTTEIVTSLNSPL